MTEITKPKISIIIPAFNSEKTIERSINSVKNQSYSNKEIIVVNDGSFDNTETVLKKYKDSIKIITIENRGVSNARNIGIKHSTGEYIFFLDSDDYLLPDSLNVMAKNIDDKDILCCSFVIEYDTKKRKYNYENLEMDQKQFVKRLCKIGTNVDYMYAWGKLYKKGILEEEVFPKGIKIGEDVVAIARAALRCKRIKTIDTTVYVYDRRKSYVTKNIFSTDYLDLYSAWNLIKNEFIKTNLDYVEYANINILRLDFTILTRLLLSDSRTKKENSKLIINANNRLRKNYKKLLFSEIVLSRKVAITLVLIASDIYKIKFYKKKKKL